MGIHRTRRGHRPRVMPKTAQTISQKSKKVFLNITWGRKGKQRASLQGHELTQKSLDNQNSLILKTSELVKRIFL